MKWVQVSPDCYVEVNTRYMLRREDARYLHDWLLWKRIEDDWFFRDTFDALEDALEYEPEGEKQPA